MEVKEIPAADEANRLGNVKAANMVLLGAYTRCRGFLSPEAVTAAIREFFSRKGKEMVSTNLKAFQRGYELT